MPRTESPESARVKDFLQESPESTFKHYLAKYPDTTMSPAYFSILKSKMKNPEKMETKAEKPAKVKAEKKVAVEKPEKAEKVAKTKNGDGETKIKPVKVAPEVVKQNKKYKIWLETGIGEGFIQNPEKYV